MLPGGVETGAIDGRSGGRTIGTSTRGVGGGAVGREGGIWLGFDGGGAGKAAFNGRDEGRREGLSVRLVIQPRIFASFGLRGN
jgi:hypothetical protein